MKHSRSSLFLMELIIAILFFSLASAVCIRLFVKSHIISESTVNQNNAITYAQNMAEVWLSVEGDSAQLSEFFPEASASHVYHSDAVPQNDTTSSCYQLIFDTDWNACDNIPTSGDYFVSSLCTMQDSDDMLHAYINVCEITPSETNIVYSLELIHHVAERRTMHE